MVAGLMKVGAGDGSDFSVTIMTGGEVVTETGFRDEAQVIRDYDPLQDRVSMSIEYGGEGSRASNEGSRQFHNHREGSY